MTKEERNGRERRRTPRVRVQHDLKLHGSEGEDALHAKSIDLSLGGIYCTVDRFVSTFTKLSLALRLPLHDDSGHRHWFEVPCEGVVVRVEPDEPTPGVTAYRCALAFIHTDPDVELVIAKYLLQTISRTSGDE